jgi:hypothetical protein
VSDNSALNNPEYGIAVSSHYVRLLNLVYRSSVLAKFVKKNKFLLFLVAI